jgi:hypothetical protein
LRRRKTRTKSLELGAAAAAALLLGGCGSDGGNHAAPPPSLPRPVATALAARSDALAAALEAGDSCRAAGLAAQLQRDTIGAINSHRVPGALQEPLSAGVNDLVSRVQCVPKPPPKEHGHGKREGHGKKGKEGD